MNCNFFVTASKISESLIQERGDDEVDEKEKEDDEGTVSESSGEEDMCELTLGNSASRYRPNLHHHHNEEASTVSLKQFFHNFIISNSGNVNQLLVWLLSFDLIFGGQGYGYGQLNDDDYKSWSDDYESLYKFYLMRAPLGSSYVPPGLPLHKENNVSLKHFYFTSLYPPSTKTRMVYHRNVIVLMNLVVLISC